MSLNFVSIGGTTKFKFCGPEDVVPHNFTQFFRTKRKKRGKKPNQNERTDTVDCVGLYMKSTWMVQTTSNMRKNLEDVSCHVHMW